MCGAPQQKSREKKMERIEETLKSDNRHVSLSPLKICPVSEVSQSSQTCIAHRAMQKKRMKSTLAAGIILMLTFAVLSQMSVLRAHICGICFRMENSTGVPIPCPNSVLACGVVSEGRAPFVGWTGWQSLSSLISPSAG